MSSSRPSVQIPLRALPVGAGPATRLREPVTVGVPVPAGAMPSATGIGVVRGDGVAVPSQTRVLDAWPDGSVRWLLVDCQVDVEAGQVSPLFVAPVDEESRPAEVVDVSVTDDGVRVRTGRAVFGFRPGGAFPMSEVDAPGCLPLDAGASGLRIHDRGSTAPVPYEIARVAIEASGPLRVALRVEARPRGVTGAGPVAVHARVELFAGHPSARVALTLHNPRRARHAGGQWGLGDPGSILLESAVVEWRSASPIGAVRASVASGQPAVERARPFEVAQESSGGPHWDGPVHRNREGRVPYRFRGYRVTAGDRIEDGLRADPVVTATQGPACLSVASPRFWAHFPRAVRVDRDTISLALFPAGASDVHELQGGEQKTHRFVVAFGPDPVSSESLAWCLDPVRLAVPPDVVAASAAVPGLTRTLDPACAALVAVGLDPGRGFLAKREQADEFGWRDFGDLPADHESAFQPPDRPFVSHYNNQYDAAAGFLRQYLRSGDPAWWELGDDLVHHVVDIDIYRTTEDKSAYNGGLFWHTNHYVDAGTSTHRTYAPGGAASGGPSAEHNYNAGLMLHYFLTGDPASRDAAIGLGRWVLDMDDGRTTVFRWLAGGPTGLAGFTGNHYGPGRGAGHSIRACLVAHRLTGDGVYLDMAEALIRRCVHPDVPVGPEYAADVEGRWSYTAFLQALGIYLEDKVARGERDEMYGYARACLLQFARWMRDHETPYLDTPDRLEFPTQTWAAQDLRKAEVFAWAALCADGGERAAFHERARFFHRYAVETLPTLPGSWYTRPLVLVLTNGTRFGWFESQLAAGVHWPAGPALDRWRRAEPFEPQRARAIRRARGLVLAGTLAVLAAVAVIALRWWF